MHTVNAFSGNTPGGGEKPLAAPELKTVEVGPHTIRVFQYGKEHVSSGVPTVVFENGLGSDIEDWDSLLTKVGEFAPVIAYDRPGIGESSDSGFDPSPANVAALLHEILGHLGAEPPFILVGFSLGGPYARMYASTYEEEIAGVVYIDPMDFTETRQNKLDIFIEIGSGPEGLDENEEITNKYVEEVQHGQAYQEWLQAKALRDDDFKRFREAAPQIPVPQAILCSARGPLPLGEYSFDFPAYAKLYLQHRISRLMKWVTSLEEGYFVVTPSSPHKIHGDDPDLVAWAIKRVMFPDPSRLLIDALLKKGEAEFISEYRRLKMAYPAERFGEDLLNILGYKLLFSEETQKALAVFNLNVAEFPEGANPHDSLGECHMILGDKESAIKNYARSLELDPTNKNAENKLEELRRM